MIGIRIVVRVTLFKGDYFHMAIETLKSRVQESRDVDKGLYINGSYVPASSGKTFDVVNPATEEVIAQVSEADEKDIDTAATPARTACDNPAWTKVEAAERTYIIYKSAGLSEEHRAELAQREALDNGKPYMPALEDDVDGTIQQFRYYSGWATTISTPT